MDPVVAKNADGWIEEASVSVFRYIANLVIDMRLNCNVFPTTCHIINKS